MKFYQNKKNGEIIGVFNMRQLIDFPNENSIFLGYIDYSYKIVYDMICPNYLIPNGVVSFSITHMFLKNNYKRIKKEIALEKYPNFKQYDYTDLLKESSIKKCDKLSIIKSQKF